MTPGSAGCRAIACANSLGRVEQTVVRDIAGSLVRARRAVQRSDRRPALIFSSLKTSMGNCPYGARACGIVAGGADEVSECDGASSSWLSALLRHRLSRRTRGGRTRASRGGPHRHLIHAEDNGGESGDDRQRRSHRGWRHPATRSRTGSSPALAQPANFRLFVECSLPYWGTISRSPRWGEVREHYP